MVKIRIQTGVEATRARNMICNVHLIYSKTPLPKIRFSVCKVFPKRTCVIVDNILGHSLEKGQKDVEEIHRRFSTLHEHRRDEISMATCQEKSPCVVGNAVRHFLTGFCILGANIQWQISKFWPTTDNVLLMRLRANNLGLFPPLSSTVKTLHIDIEQPFHHLVKNSFLAVRLQANIGAV